MPGRAEPQASRWLAQASDDLGASTHLQTLGIHYASCFFAQQAGEKALKAALLALELVPSRTHAVAELAAAVEVAWPAGAGLQAEVGLLDQYDIPTRYPDALPGGLPSSIYGPSDSTRALTAAARCLEVAREVLAGGGAD